MITNTDGVKNIIFGHGSLRVAAGEIDEDGTGALLFWSADPEPFGTEHCECIGKDDLANGVDTRIIFSDSQQVDMVIEYLEVIKAMLNKPGGF